VRGFAIGFVYFATLMLAVYLMSVRMLAPGDVERPRLEAFEYFKTGLFFGAIVALVVMLGVIGIGAMRSALYASTMLLVVLAAVALIIAAIAWLPIGGGVPALILLVLAGVALTFVSAGFYFLQPNQAAAILLFGDYKGTDRTAGLRWRLPWLMRSKISTRIHNITSDKLKVNDQRGNPIDIAANVVWRVTDTAQALFDVDNYQEFIDIQIESAVRAIAGKYPYDDIEHEETTLRADAEIVNGDLEAELQDRVARAGISIDEARIMHLAYAQEIAQAMLRRQQAEAVIDWLRTSLSPLFDFIREALLASYNQLSTVLNMPPSWVMILLLAVIGFLTGRPEFLDLAIVYGLLNVVGTIAVLKFFRHGDLGDPGEEPGGVLPPPEQQALAEHLPVAGHRHGAHGRGRVEGEQDRHRLRSRVTGKPGRWGGVPTRCTRTIRRWEPGSGSRRWMSQRSSGRCEPARSGHSTSTISFSPPSSSHPSSQSSSGSRSR
jgi:regulator of protease activity HflC (stomatin/prohibitin superfamily)